MRPQILNALDYALKIRIAGAKLSGNPVPTATCDLRTISDYVELSGFSWPCYSVDIESLLNEGRETRDLGFVILSCRAVNDFDLHSVLHHG